MPTKIGAATPKPVQQPAARPAAKAPAAAATTPKSAGWSPKGDAKPQSYDAASATLEMLRRTLPAGATDVKTPATRPAGSLTTGTGGKLDLKLDGFQPQMTPSGYVMPYKMSVVYEDQGGYFKGAQSVKAWSQLTGSDGAVAATLDNLQLERQADGRYVGTAFVTQKAQGSVGLKDVAFAFSANGQWDSNQGHNYHLGL